jgi:hypothetical protein
MESKKPFDQLYDPHKKAEDAIDHAREVREQKITMRGKAAALPHLITGGNVQRCSVCGYPFPPDVKPRIDAAFVEHLSKAHKPGRTTEDANQAAARVIRESTDKV